MPASRAPAKKQSCAMKSAPKAGSKAMKAAAVAPAAKKGSAAAKKTTSAAAAAKKTGSSTSMKKSSSAAATGGAAAAKDGDKANCHDGLEALPLDPGSGGRTYKDKTFDQKNPALSESATHACSKPAKDGTATSIFAKTADQDLSAKQQQELHTKGISDDLVYFPWGIVRAGTQSGTPLKDHDGGHQSWLITFAQPRKKSLWAQACPKTVTDQQFCDVLVTAHRAYGVTLHKVVVRRERPGGHEHLHAAVFTEYKRYRWKRISDWCRGQHKFFLNFEYIPFPAAVGYLLFLNFCFHSPARLSDSSTCNFYFEFLDCVSPSQVYHVGIEQKMAARLRRPSTIVVRRRSDSGKRGGAGAQRRPRPQTETHGLY